MKEDVFICPSCPPECRKRMHLYELREHVAEKHLDNYHVFHCPKCNKKFATGLQAHKHIREVCKISGIVPMQHYTTALLSYDATYVNKMYKIELASIFRYVMACVKGGKPSSDKATGTDPIETTSTEVQCNVDNPADQNKKASKNKSKRNSRSGTELENESKPFARQSTDSGTDSASTGTRTDLLSEMASPRGAVKDEKTGLRPVSPNSISNSVDVEPPSECGENDSDSMENFSVKMEQEERTSKSSKNDQNDSYKNSQASGRSPQESVPEAVPEVPLLKPKKEPVDVEDNAGPELRWRFFKREPEPEIPPPASPESHSDSIDLDQCSVYGDPPEDKRPSSHNFEPETAYPDPPVYQTPSYTGAYVDPSYVDPSHVHPFNADPRAYQYANGFSENQVPLAPETEEARMIRIQLEMIAQKFKGQNHATDVPHDPNHSSSRSSPPRDPRLRKDDKPRQRSKESRDRTEANPVPSQSNVDYNELKNIVYNSRYHRIVREDHVCEYENCCDYTASGGLHCIFCNGLHCSLNCISFPTHSTRQAEAKRRKICMKCAEIHPQQGRCVAMKCLFCKKHGHYGAFCFHEKTKAWMKERAVTHFSRWLPNIPELDALKKRRRHIVYEQEQRQKAEDSEEAKRKEQSKTRLENRKRREEPRPLNSKRRRRHDD